MKKGREKSTEKLIGRHSLVMSVEYGWVMVIIIIIFSLDLLLTLYNIYIITEQISTRKKT